MRELKNLSGRRKSSYDHTYHMKPIDEKKELEIASTKLKELLNKYGMSPKTELFIITSMLQIEMPLTKSREYSLETTGQVINALKNIDKEG